mmetsp:Transcript_9949/g.21092  ORF Transcript_9949/g.21092 Transcript_9949/m.21092 type:complete len:565 (-) Transcript_9949:103-1797(-)
MFKALGRAFGGSPSKETEKKTEDDDEEFKEPEEGKASGSAEAKEPEFQEAESAPAAVEAKEPEFEEAKQSSSHSTPQKDSSSQKEGTPEDDELDDSDEIMEHSLHANLLQTINPGLRLLPLVEILQQTLLFSDRLEMKITNSQYFAGSAIAKTTKRLSVPRPVMSPLNCMRLLLRARACRQREDDAKLQRFNQEDEEDAPKQELSRGFLGALGKPFIVAGIGSGPPPTVEHSKDLECRVPVKPWSVVSLEGSWGTATPQIGQIEVSSLRHAPSSQFRQLPDIWRSSREPSTTYKPPQEPQVLLAQVCASQGAKEAVSGWDWSVELPVPASNPVQARRFGRPSDSGLHIMVMTGTNSKWSEETPSMDPTPSLAFQAGSILTVPGRAFLDHLGPDSCPSLPSIYEMQLMLLEAETKKAAIPPLESLKDVQKDTDDEEDKEEEEEKKPMLALTAGKPKSLEVWSKPLTQVPTKNESVGDAVIFYDMDGDRIEFEYTPNGEVWEYADHKLVVEDVKQLTLDAETGICYDGEGSFTIPQEYRAATVRKLKRLFGNAGFQKLVGPTIYVN